jgi:hypothetical protein
MVFPFVSKNAERSEAPLPFGSRDGGNVRFFS